MPPAKTVKVNNKFNRIIADVLRKVIIFNFFIAN